MSATPEIVAVTTAREASDRARALEALSDHRSLGERIVLGLLIFAVAVSGPVLKRSGVFGTDTFAMLGFEFALLIAVVLGAEVYHLRRRVKAITRRQAMSPNLSLNPDPCPAGVLRRPPARAG